MARNTGSRYLRRDPFELPSCRPMSRTNRRFQFPTLLNRLRIRKAVASVASERARHRRAHRWQVRRTLALEGRAQCGTFSWPFTQPGASDPRDGSHNPQAFEELRDSIDCMKWYEILHVHIISPPGLASQPPDAGLQFLGRIVHSGLQVTQQCAGSSTTSRILTAGCQSLLCNAAATMGGQPISDMAFDPHPEAHAQTMLYQLTGLVEVSSLPLFTFCTLR